MECNLCATPIMNGPETFWSSGPDSRPYCDAECHRIAVAAGVDREAQYGE